MKIISALLLACCSFGAFAQQRDYPIQPVPFTSVKLADKFWTSRIETNRTATIPASFARCESTGRVKNFVMAADHQGKFCTAYPFDDTDIYKGSIKTPDGNDLAVTYNFKVDGDKLTGTAESPAGQVTVDNGKITGDTFTFKVTVDGNDYPHSGKLYADSCGLDIDFGGQKIHTTLKRAQ